MMPRKRALINIGSYSGPETLAVSLWGFISSLSLQRNHIPRTMMLLLIDNCFIGNLGLDNLLSLIISQQYFYQFKFLIAGKSHEWVFLSFGSLYFLREDILITSKRIMCTIR